jgi:hypothetical protein
MRQRYLPPENYQDSAQHPEEPETEPKVGTKTQRSASKETRLSDIYHSSNLLNFERSKASWLWFFVLTL